MLRLRACVYAGRRIARIRTTEIDDDRNRNRGVTGVYYAVMPMHAEPIR